MDVREGVVSQRFGYAALDQIGGRVHLGGAQIFNDRSRFAVGGITALLGMNCFDHVAHLTNPGCRHMAEDIPVKMNHAALPLSIRQIFRGTLHQASASVGDNELHAVEAIRRDRTRRCAIPLELIDRWLLHHFFGYTHSCQHRFIKLPAASVAVLVTVEALSGLSLFGGRGTALHVA
jgi:hypothetical protein